MEEAEACSQPLQKVRCVCMYMAQCVINGGDQLFTQWRLLL